MKLKRTALPLLAVIIGVVALSGAAFADEWDGDWYGEGDGSATWGIYTINVFAEWEMTIMYGVVTGEWRDDVNNADGDIVGSVSDVTDYGSGTWDTNNPACPLHGTWEADFYIEDGYKMEGHWYYYNAIGQKILGGNIWGYSPRSGIPD